MSDSRKPDRGDYFRAECTRPGCIHRTRTDPGSSYVVVPVGGAVELPARCFEGHVTVFRITTRPDGDRTPDREAGDHT